MDTATLSTKYQLVIPRGARERLQLRPGMRFTVIDNRSVERPLIGMANLLRAVDDE